MRKTGMCVLAVLALAVPASAQSAAAPEKLAGKAHCAKSDPNYMVDVGDKPGHMLTMQKTTCTWTDGKIAGLTPKSADDQSTGEVTGASGRSAGYHTVTMDNGDKYTVRYTGSMAIAKDNSATFEGKWTMVSGTGKLKGIKGSGTYQGTGASDGSGDVAIDGEFTLAPAKPAMPAKKK